MTGVLLELGVLLAVLGLLGRLALAYGLSPVPLYLLVGLALGYFGEEPITFSREVVEIGAQIGVVLLLFMLGLEYAGHELGSSLRAALPSAAFDAVMNFTPGFVIALVLGWSPLAAFVLGGVTYISSSAIVAKVIDDFGRREEPETPVILALLVLEDLAMAAYLPLLAVLLAGTALLAAVGSLVAAAVFAAIALTAALRWGMHMTRVLSPQSEEVFLLSVFGFALIVAGAAEGLLHSAAVGAFLAGIAVSGPVVERARGMLTPLRDLFAAGFFVFFGLQVDVTALPDVALPAVALAVVTSLTKVWTGWRAAARAGVDRAGCWRAGSALVARGEFSIIIAGIAVSAGVEPRLAALAGAYVLLTAFAGTLLTRTRAPRQVAA
jgi:CPA2 family monovalent cation:H+ antiporter-2